MVDKNPAAVSLGAMGGAAGTGDAKRRSTEHYRAAGAAGTGDAKRRSPEHYAAMRAAKKNKKKL